MSAGALLTVPTQTLPGIKRAEQIIKADAEATLRRRQERKERRAQAKDVVRTDACYESSRSKK